MKSNHEITSDAHLFGSYFVCSLLNRIVKINAIEFVINNKSAPLP